VAGIKSFNKPNDFFIGSYSHIGAMKETLNSLATSNTDVESTSSFRYDSYGSGIRSTQQVHTDFSKFENHTFFNSAQANVNVAFDKIINNYPFDGTKPEIESFLDSLTGFEKYVYDQFPKNKGYLIFSGATGGTALGAHIVVRDEAGVLFPTLAKNLTGEPILDPGSDKSFSLEMQLFVPELVNDVQCICQKTSGSNSAGLSTQGISLFLNTSPSTTTAPISFYVVRGDQFVTASCDIDKGKFNHIVATFNRTSELNIAALYVNEELIVTSSNSATIGAIDFKADNFVIGSGSSIFMEAASAIYGVGAPTTVIPASTFSGALDELRVFHNIRPIEQQKLYAKKAVFAQDDLKLYYKFNEPSGTLGPTEGSTINKVVLDSSGNSLHAEITNFDFALRATSSNSTIGPLSPDPPADPLTYEKSEFTPILFPSFGSVLNLNNLLIASASNYDTQNPNIITNLIPQHYFLEGQIQEGLENITGSIGDAYGGTSIPGSGELGTAQILSSFLFVWAKTFDELKIFISAFRNLLHVDYETNDVIPDNFLIFLANYYGFQIPSYFFKATLEQFVEGENVDNNVSTSQDTLMYVQNQILKRILTNIRDIINSKGTLHGVKSLIRALGIDPDNSLRIREFGGPRTLQIGAEREIKKYFAGMLNMSASQALVRSHYLSGSRIEVGYPEIAGTFVDAPGPFEPSIYGIHGISNDPNDGLLTSGSWTYEAIYKYNLSSSFFTSVTQSLARFQTTGSAILDFTGLSTPQLTVNLVAITSSIDSDNRLQLYVKTGYGAADESTDRVLKLALTGTTIFDGNRWNISFGRTRDDAINSTVSSSYFLRCAQPNRGKIAQFFQTSSYFQESVASDDVLQEKDDTFNASGSFIAIGNESLDAGSAYAGYRFLNNTTLAEDDARAVTFDGKVSNLRFWSKSFKVPDWLEHIRNPKSFGVENPLVNFNFDTTVSGAFERLRLDAEMLQETTGSDSIGNVTLFDYSQFTQLAGTFITAPWLSASAEFIATSSYYQHMSGSGFEPLTSIVAQEEVVYSYYSPYFDESVLTERVRVRSLQNPSITTSSIYAKPAPVYELTNAEEILDDPRFSIDFSVIDALNQDIIKMFSTLEALDSALGNPELLFTGEYPDLIDLRKIYFNRLTSRIRLDQFLKLFKWFDSLLSGMLVQLLPRKTIFLGVNFIVENHTLERSKMQYKFTDAYTPQYALNLFPKASTVQIIEGGDI